MAENDEEIEENRSEIKQYRMKEEESMREESDGPTPI